MIYMSMEQLFIFTRNRKCWAQPRKKQAYRNAPRGQGGSSAKWIRRSDRCVFKPCFMIKTFAAFGKLRNLLDFKFLADLIGLMGAAAMSGSGTD